MKAFLLLAFISSHQYSCDDIKAAVNVFGEKMVFRLAKQAGATPQMLSVAKQCLRK